MPELLWKAYIDFETEEGEREKARALYERLLALSGHVKVWISYALFEATPLPLSRSQREEDEDDERDETPMVPGDIDVARRVFERGYQDLKSKSLKPEVRNSEALTLAKVSLYMISARRPAGKLEGIRGGKWHGR